MKKFADKLAALKNRENEEGFTLIELVIVVAIIGILTAIAIPSYGAIQATARQNSVEAAASDAYTAALAQIANGETAADAATAVSSADDIVVEATADGTDGVTVQAYWAADGSADFASAVHSATKP